VENETCTNLRTSKKKVIEICIFLISSVPVALKRNNQTQEEGINCLQQCNFYRGFTVHTNTPPLNNVFTELVYSSSIHANIRDQPFLLIRGDLDFLTQATTCDISRTCRNCKKSLKDVAFDYE